MFDYAINALDSSESYRSHPPTADRNGGKRPCESGCERTPWLQEGHRESVMVVLQDEVAVRFQTCSWRKANWSSRGYSERLEERGET